MIRKPNTIIVLLFIQNNSQFKNMSKTCLPPSIHRFQAHLRQCTFRVVQLRKCSPNSRCHPSSCLLAVLAMFLAIFRLVLSLETSEMSAIFQVHNQNNSTSSPGLLGQRCINLQESCIFDVVSSLNTKFFQIWSSVTGYDELNVCFQPIRIGENFE